MVAALIIFSMVLYALLCLLGIMANAFIVVVLGREWVRCHRLSPSDMILISLGISRFCLQWVGMINCFYYFLHRTQYNTGLARQYFGLYWDFLNTSTFWFGTWLSVLFCVKIANFTHPIFLWLKWRVNDLIPWLLLVSLLISFIVTMLFFVGNNIMYQAFLKGTFSGNLTLYGFAKRLEIQYFLPLKLIALSIPCSMFIVSTVLLIASLRRHSCRMQHSARRTQDPSAQAHSRALKFLVSFLVLYALSFLSSIIDAAVFALIEKIWYWPWQILIFLCVSIHPFILIFGNSQLGGTLRKLLRLPKTFCNDKGTSSPS
ncbi:bitter taste receptor Modo-T2R41 [Monodelphis domestica]|uniref:Taste receptor type 2 n=1 Tax=Monodelphis domestica TaxID=13616 RepID=Q2AB86_MONDO|nr:bitter taste receptor Modo-T2R41 [Monodelphis domestica]BAE80381.1 bitter taste receptor [Monodelphis domestica]